MFRTVAMPAMCNTLMLSSCSCIAVAGQVVVLTIEINLFPSALWITHTMPPCHMIIHTIQYIPHGFAHHTTCASWIIRTIPHHTIPHCMPAGSASDHLTNPAPAWQPTVWPTMLNFFSLHEKTEQSWSEVVIASIYPLLPLSKSDSWGYLRHPKAKWLTKLVILFCCKLVLSNED